jgi:hypothetical protein
LQIPNKYLQFLVDGFCIMRRLGLKACILTAVESTQLKASTSQQVAQGVKLRTKGTGIDAHLKASELFKIPELKNDR